MTTRPRTFISHSRSSPLVRQLTATLQERGYDFILETGFLYRQDGTLARLVASLPAPCRAPVERELLRRHDPRIDTARIRQNIPAEILSLAMRKLGLPEPLEERATIWRDRMFDRRVARKLPRDIDLVIVQDGQALATARAARRAGIVSVLNETTGHPLRALRTYREEAKHHPEFADSLSTHMPLSAFEFMRAEVLEADHVLAPSEFVRQTLLEQGVDDRRISLLPYGVDTDRFRPDWAPASDGRFRILYVGNIGQKKGIKYLLEAIRRLGRADIALTLVGRVVGAGAGLAPYRDLFTHMPHVPYFQVHEMFRNADLFVYPSLHEGAAFANLEAMAAGLPVVTTHNAGSVVRDGIDGFVVPIRSIEALVDRIALLRRDPDKRAAMGRSARERAEQFTWHHYGDNLDRLLRGFTARRP